MAFWAERMTWATWATVIVTFIGLMLILATLYYTKVAAKAAKEMVEEAKKTTIETQKTVEVTREIGEAQIRAYLSVTSAWFVGPAPKKSVFIGLGAAIRNSGNSPAKNIVISYEVSTVQDELGAFENLEFGKSKIAAIAAGSQKDAFDSGTKITNAYITEEKAALMVEVAVEWTDVFEHVCSSNQTFLVNITRNEKGISSECTEISGYGK